MRPPGGAARRGGGAIRRSPRGSGRWRFALPTARKVRIEGGLDGEGLRLVLSTLSGL